jgi:putative oxidoreductase
MYGKTDRTRYPVNMPSRNCRKVAGSDNRTAAFAIGVDMLVAAILVHVHFGFFMNWLGKEKGEGIEFDLLVWAIALALILQAAERSHLTE